MPDKSNFIEVPSTYFPQELLEQFEKNLPDDFTFYLEKCTQIEELFEKLNLNNTAAGKNIFEPLQLTINLCGKENVIGRALICLAYSDKLWSVTFRRIGNAKSTDSEPVGRNYSKEWEKKKWDTGYSPSPDRNDNLNSLKELCEVLKNELFVNQYISTYRRSNRVGDTDKNEFQGLIVITGATASAKSQIARGLIDGYLKESVQFDKKNFRLLIRDVRI